MAEVVLRVDASSRSDVASSSLNLMNMTAERHRRVAGRRFTL